MEISRRIGYFTAQANANIRRDNPQYTEAQLHEEGLFFDDNDMFRAQGINHADCYIGTDDASIWAIKFGTAYPDYCLCYEGTNVESVDTFTHDEERWSVELYELKFRDTNESIYAVERSDDTGRPVVTFYECPAEAQDAFDEECGEDMDGGRC
jgi:hypothetical protein